METNKCSINVHHFNSVKSNFLTYGKMLKTDQIHYKLKQNFYIDYTQKKEILIIKLS